MVWSKRILHFDDQSKQVVSLVFSKRNRNMFSVFLSSYRNTCESLGEPEKAVEILACGSCSHSISHFPKLPLIVIFIVPLNSSMLSILSKLLVIIFTLFLFYLGHHVPSTLSWSDQEGKTRARNVGPSVIYHGMFLCVLDGICSNISCKLPSVVEQVMWTEI